MYYFNLYNVFFQINYAYLTRVAIKLLKYQLVSEYKLERLINLKGGSCTEAISRIQ